MNRLIIFFIVVVSLLLSSLVYGAGIAEYTKAIDESPEDMKYKFHFLRGLVYRGQGNIDLAIKDFSTSIQMRPSYDAYMRRGEMYFEKGAYNIAEDNFTEAIEMNPSIEAYKLRGLTYLVLGKLDMAIIDGTKIINKAPNTSESYNIRMEAYAQIGQPKLAREDARRALSLNRNNGARRFRPKDEIEKYRVWANNKGFAFSRRPAADGSAPQDSQ
jgi:tetratricopeptide (TPR) repeat protein